MACTAKIVVQSYVLGRSFAYLCFRAALQFPKTSLLCKEKKSVFCLFYCPLIRPTNEVISQTLDRGTRYSLAILDRNQYYSHIFSLNRIIYCYSSGSDVFVKSMKTGHTFYYHKTEKRLSDCQLSNFKWPPPHACMQYGCY